MRNTELQLTGSQVNLSNRRSIESDTLHASSRSRNLHHSRPFSATPTPGKQLTLPMKNQMRPHSAGSCQRGQCQVSTKLDIKLNNEIKAGPENQLFIPLKQKMVTTVLVFADMCLETGKDQESSEEKESSVMLEDADAPTYSDDNTGSQFSVVAQDDFHCECESKEKIVPDDKNDTEHEENSSYLSHCSATSAKIENRYKLMENACFDFCKNDLSEKVISSSKDEPSTIKFQQWFQFGENRKEFTNNNKITSGFPKNQFAVDDPNDHECMEQKLNYDVRHVSNISQKLDTEFVKGGVINEKKESLDSTITNDKSLNPREKQDAGNFIPEHPSDKRYLKEIIQDKSKPVSSDKNDGSYSSRVKLSGDNRMLKEIISYLDEIEDNSVDIIEDNIDWFNLKFHRNSDEINNEQRIRQMELENQQELCAANLAENIRLLQLRLEDRERSLELARRMLTKQQEKIQHSQKVMQARILSCKKEYEVIIARHQKFIDQILSDKKCLNEKCESLVHEMKAAEERHMSNLKASEERHRIEMQKAREKFAAAEKLRRDKWIENKTKKIKEMTVRGMEPELQRMTERHEQEIKKLLAQHERQLIETRQDTAKQLAEQAQHLKEEATQAVEREAVLLRDRYEKHVQELELSHQEQRNRQQAEIFKEKELLAIERIQLKEEMREEKNKMSALKAKELEEIRKEYSESLKAIEKKYQNDTELLRAALEVEKNSWLHNTKKEQELYLLEKEAEIRVLYKNDRDQAVEKVIEKLEADSAKVKLEFERTAEANLQILKQKFNSEIKELENSVILFKNKFVSAKEKLLEKEDEIISLQTTVRQLEKELSESQKILEKLSNERANVKEVIRIEFISQIMDVEKDNVELREKMAEMRACHQMEIFAKDKELESARTEKDCQLQNLYERVREAISKKEKTVAEWKMKYAAVSKQCSHLEKLLEQHQRDYLCN